MRTLILLTTLLSFACTTAQYQQKTYIPQDKRPEEVTALPEDPEKMTPPEDLPPGEKAVHVEKGEPAPEAGILLTERKAWRHGQYVIAYKALRDLDTADRNVWVTHRLYYEDGLNQRDKKIEEQRPGWWDENKGWVGAVLGFLGGAAVTIGIAAAVNESTN